MRRRVIVRPEATADIRAARKWYRKISPALADDFVIALNEAIEAARDRPATFQVVYGSFRRVVMRQFPYSCSLSRTANERSWQPCSIRRATRRS